MSVEVQGDAGHWRVNTEKERTHALWRLGHWALEHHDLTWRPYGPPSRRVSRTDSSDRRHRGTDVKFPGSAHRTPLIRVRKGTPNRARARLYLRLGGHLGPSLTPRMCGRRHRHPLADLTQGSHNHPGGSVGLYPVHRPAAHTDQSQPPAPTLARPVSRFRSPRTPNLEIIYRRSLELLA